MLHKMEEKQSFYGELKCELVMHSAGELLTRLGVFNGYVSRYIGGFDGVHGWYGVDHWKNIISTLSGEGIMCVKYMA